MSIWDSIASLWQKERSVDAEEEDGLTSLAVKGQMTVADMSAILSVHVSIGRDELPREFEAFEAMTNSFNALANHKDIEKNCGAIVAEWRALQKPMQLLIKRCAVLPKDASDVATAQCRSVAVSLPVLILRLDGIVKIVSAVSRNRARKAA